MAKEKTVYKCSQCSKTHPRWSGQCESCKEWNTLVETTLQISTSLATSKVAHKAGHFSVQLEKPSQNTNIKKTRISTGLEEFDRVLGGGFFPGSLSLLTGDPGVGKSTICLHVLINIAKNMPEKKIILISGEESVMQISDRIFRICKKIPENLFLISDGIWEHILPLIPKEETGFLLFDSIQTIATLDISSASGSITQSVAIVERIMLLAKEYTIPTLLIGHVTKTGEMAGPQTMAHLVDSVLSLEAEGISEYRMLRSKKNRFGSVSEIGIFEMKEEGITEVKNPSQNFLSGRLENAIGSAIFPSLEGSRSYLMEIQALTKYTSFGYPKRSTSGFDLNRLSIILAVIGRFTEIKLENEDVFVNIAGGLKTSEPACDLAVISAIISSKKKIALDPKCIFLGEVGLSGEIRMISHLEKRINEAKKMGFTKAFIPKGVQENFSIPCIEIRSIQDLEKQIH